MRVSIICLLLLSSVFISAQEKLTPDQKNVQQTVINVFQGIADRDTAAMLSPCTKDILVLEGGLVWTRDSLKLKIAQNTAPDYQRINTFTFLNTTVKGKVAWTTYYNQADVTKNGRHSIVKWLETAILVREKKSWKLKTLHSSLVERV